jgi:hypothetical protein
MVKSPTFNKNSPFFDQPGNRVSIEKALLVDQIRIENKVNKNYTSWLYVFDYLGSCLIWHSGTKREFMKIGCSYSMDVNIEEHLAESICEPYGIKKTLIKRPSKLKKIEEEHV